MSGAITPLVVLACEPFGATSEPPAVTDGGTSAVDTQSAPDAAPSARFCEQALDAEFCDDFEGEGRRPEANWGNAKIDVGGTLEIGQSPSGTRALHVKLASGAASRDVRLGRDIKVPSGLQQLTLDVRVLLVTSTLDFARFATFWMSGPSFFRAEGVSLYAKTERILDGDSNSNEPNVRSLPAQWHTVRVSLDRVDAGFRATTSIDGVVVSDRTRGINDGVRYELYAGLFTTSDNDGSAELWIDDVLVKLR